MPSPRTDRVSTRAATASSLSRARCSTSDDRALARSIAISEQIREWCSRTDTHVTVKPVIDLADHAGAHVEAYEIPDRLRDMVTDLHPACVFPWCTKQAARCDLDHTRPHGQGGATCLHNLAPLCRHHHRLKTHTAWDYRPLDPVDEPGVYLWTDPHRLTYLRTPIGTKVLTDTPR